MADDLNNNPTPAPLPPSSTILGSVQADRLLGTDADEDIIGREGDDYLVGSGGNDRLEGGNGWDRLRGGPGNDRLTGGPDEGDEANSFVFGPRDGNDRITDFSIPQGDLLYFGAKGRASPEVLEAVTENGSGDAVLTYDQTTITLSGVPPADVLNWAASL